MSLSKDILKEIEKVGFQIVTDTRMDVSGKGFFALNGENFDGSDFIDQAFKKGASFAVTENSNIKRDKVYLVDDVLHALQESARIYRESFSIPIIAIGGSNGKTTTRELVKEVLATRYKVHSSKGNLNNHIGLPLSILSMDRNAELGVFEIGANHPGEHLALLNILSPTHVVITNNGLDHLEGFGSPEGVRLANKEIYDWAKAHGAMAFVDKNKLDLVEDSSDLVEKILYPKETLDVLGGTPLELKFADKIYHTQMSGEYNLDNIYTALAIGEYWGLGANESMDAIENYVPSLQRSQFIKIADMDVILDCYNANPSSMRLSLESFLNSNLGLRGVVLGDMLELGDYSEEEHRKIIDLIYSHKVDCVILIGGEFKKALSDRESGYHWFLNSGEAREWFDKQDFTKYTFLLKGSRGMKVENILGL